jgi:hypothetical protein
VSIVRCELKIPVLRIAAFDDEFLVVNANHHDLKSNQRIRLAFQSPPERLKLNCFRLQRPIGEQAFFMLGAHKAIRSLFNPRKLRFARAGASSKFLKLVKYWILISM